MRIEWATFCKEVTATDDGANLIAVNQDTSLITGLPSNVRITLAVNLAISSEEPTPSQHVMSFEVIDPDGRSLGVQNQRFQIDGMDPTTRKGWEAKHVFANLLVFQTDKDGPHTVVATLDDSEKVELPYFVHLLPQL